MSRARSFILAIALFTPAAGCVSAPSFDLKGLQPTGDADQATLTGHFELSGLQFRLYPGATGPDAPCLSGALTSLAGVPPPEYTNRQMTLSGVLHSPTDAEATDIPNACNGPVVMLANEVVVPRG